VAVGYLKNFFLVLFVFVSFAGSSPYVGLSTFAAMNPRFPCERFLAIVEKAQYPAMAVLWKSSFGHDPGCILKFIERFKDRDHLIEIHLTNEVCRRNGNCEQADFFPQFNVKQWNAILEERNPIAFQAIAERVMDVHQFMLFAGTEKTQVMLSLGLEDNFSPGAYSVLSNFVRERWPWLLIRNPLGNKPIGVALFRERHGTKARVRGSTRVLNEDGSNPTLKQSRRFLRENRAAFALFLWRKEHQGRRTPTHNAEIPRAGRDFHISLKDVKELGGLMQ